MTEEKKTPFTYINAINNGVDITIDDSSYNQFIINRGMSLYLDTVSISNEINKYRDIPNQVHFDFYRSLVTPKKRWAKWPKPQKHGDAALISRYYSISIQKAYDLLKVLDKDQIQKIEEELKVE